MRPGLRVLHFALLALVPYLCLPATAHAESLDCVCQAESCGNGVTPGTRGKVYRNIPTLSVERMFGPSRTGDAKTGWECGVGKGDVSQPASPPPSAPRAAAPPPAPSREFYTCTCSQESCGGSGDIMPGRKSERQELLSKGYVAAKFLPGGFVTTGWQCVSGTGEVYKAPEPDPRQRYTCTCTVASCGGKDGIIPAERGQQHTGVGLARLVPKYGLNRTGSEATGWTCKAEAPPPPPPKYTCTCSRESCGGQDSILEADRGQRHTSIPAAQLAGSYGPERTGAAATGWTCAEEGSGKPAAVAPAPVAAPPPLVVVAAESSYTCRCEGLLGCGAGGAPYAKKGELREGVPASQISALYHSDTPGGWVCAVAPPAAAPGVVQVVTDPGYVCRCKGLLGCGAGGAPYAKKGEVREGVPASQISTLYHSDTPGGWVCTTK